MITLTVKIEVIGVEPACYRCKETKENVDKAAAKLKADGIDVSVEKLDVMAKSTMDRFGVVRTPTLVVNGVIKIMGKVPGPAVIERIVRKEL